MTKRNPLEQMWFNDGSKESLAEIKAAMERHGYTPIFDKQEDGSTTVLIHRPGLNSIKLPPGHVLISDGDNVSIWARISF